MKKFGINSLILAIWIIAVSYSLGVIKDYLDGRPEMGATTVVPPNTAKPLVYADLYGYHPENNLEQGCHVDLDPSETPLGFGINQHLVGTITVILDKKSNCVVLDDQIRIKMMCIEGIDAIAWPVYIDTEPEIMISFNRGTSPMERNQAKRKVFNVLAEYITHHEKE